MSRRSRRRVPEEPDHRHHRLLRAHRERPRGRRTAEQRDELSPLHHSIISSARERKNYEECIGAKKHLVLGLLTNTGPRSRGQPWAGLLTYAPCRSGKTTPLAVSGLLQYSAQSCINCRRFSNRSPRRYAASTPLAMACASACSTTWFG